MSKPSTAASTPTRRPFWVTFAPLFIVAVGLAAYMNSCSGPFVFDDVHAIQENPTIRTLVPPGINPRPLANWSFALNYVLFGPGVKMFHVVNLLIHLLAALTLYGIVRRTLRTERLRVKFGPAADVLALIVASLWAVHPLATQAVTYIVQRSESLMGLFFLLTLYCSIRAATAERPRPWCVAAAVACALGAGAKEIIVAAPLLMVLYDRIFLWPSFREAFRKRWPLYAGLAVSWLVLGGLLFTYPPQDNMGAGFALSAITPWQYVQTEFGVITHYLRLSVWPHPLVLDYYLPIATTTKEVLLPAIIVLGLAAATIWALLRKSPLGFLGAWFFLILAPTSSIMPIIDACFEHRMYLSLAAVMAGVVMAGYLLTDWAIARFAGADAERKRFVQVLALSVAALLVVALGCLTVVRNHDYRSAIAIWEDTANKRPDNARAIESLGTSYAQTMRSKDDYENAIKYLDKAIEIRPTYAEAYNSRGGARAQWGDYAQAVKDFDKAIELKPGYFKFFSNRGKAKMGLGQLDEAIQDQTTAIDLQPKFADAYYSRANAMDAAGHPLEAIRDYTTAIELQPDFSSAYNNRSITYFRMKDYASAWDDLQSCIKYGGRPHPQYRQALEGEMRKLQEPSLPAQPGP